jgi:hypothetical protein
VQVVAFEVRVALSTILNRMPVDHGLNMRSC